MRLYLIEATPPVNPSAWHDAAACLEQAGYTVFHLPSSATYFDPNEGLAVLPGWDQDTAAHHAVHQAWHHNVPVHTVSVWCAIARAV